MGGEQSVYRGASKRQRDNSAEATEEALELMRIQSHDELQRRPVRYLPFKPTWAKLAEYIVKQLSSALITLDSDDELKDLAHVARELRERLEERDSASKARVTKETREAVLNTSGVAIVLQLLLRIREGNVQASYENAGLVSTLRQRWRRIGDVPDYVVSLVRDAVGKVLTSNVSDGIKNFYSRILLHWVPQEAPQEMRGERVSFDSDDDM
jgi:hypothetical protein